MPHQTGLPLSRLSTADLRRAAIDRGIVANIGQTTIWRWLSEDAIKPWTHRSWVFPRDPDFEAKAAPILDLYQGRWRRKPFSGNEFVISADEKPRIQCRLRTYPTTSTAPGRPMRIEHEYSREGTVNYLAAWDVHRAKVFGHCEPKSTIVSFERFVGQVMRRKPYRTAKRVFWIVDNASIHRGKASVERFRQQWPNSVLVHTPTHASWLNQVEIFFSIVQRKVLTPNDFLAPDDIPFHLSKFERYYEDIARPFQWKFTRKDLPRRWRRRRYELQSWETDRGDVESATAEVLARYQVIRESFLRTIPESTSQGCFLGAEYFGMRPRWIASAGFDLGLIIGPPVAAVLLVLALPAMRSEETPVWGWVLFVVFIDVAHVYASLHRTYFQPDEFARRRLFYLATPLACFLGGVALYSLGYQVFWRVLAYIAVFHFVRQQYGFMMVYRHRAGEHSPREALLDKCAIYATMVYPLALWHRDPSSRNFQWFVEGDFVQLPEWVATGAVVFYTASLLFFAARQVQVFALAGTVNWGKIGIVGSTAAVWYVGIALLNSDFAFTVTNVVAHGVPYMALVWLYGRRRWAGDPSWRGTIHRPVGVGLFVGLLLALAYIEEGLWELFVWQEHAEVFLGMVLNFEVPSMALTILVPLLTVPQATHYILDAKIWKFDGSNPNLHYYLFLEGEVPQAGSESKVGGR